MLFRSGISPGPSSSSRSLVSLTLHLFDSADFHVTKAQYYPHALQTPHHGGEPTTLLVSSPFDVVAPGQNAFADELPKAPKSDGIVVPVEAEQTEATGAEAEATGRGERREEVELPPVVEGTMVREEGGVQLPVLVETEMLVREEMREGEEEGELKFAEEDVEA